VKRWIAAEIGVDDKFVDRFEMTRTLKMERYAAIPACGGH
jgi:hypothetical protein